MKEWHVYKRKERGKFVGWEVGYARGKFFLICVAVFYGREALRNAKKFFNLKFWEQQQKGRPQ